MSHVPRLVPIVAFGLLSCSPDSKPEETSLPLAVENAALGEGRWEGQGRFHDDAWSAPVWLGPVVNSNARDLFPHLTNDGLSLYFHSDRAGGVGAMDIYVTRRDPSTCEWDAPVSLGPPLNTPAGDGDFVLLPGERAAFFSSAGHGGFGDTDLFIAQRIGPATDERWSEPVNLGPGVNTPAHETAAAYVEQEDGGTLYFNRNMDIFKVRVSRDGHVQGDVVPVAELNLPGIADGNVTITGDGRELIFWSGGAAGLRPGTVGLADLWVTTRKEPRGPWSEPVNVGTPVNSTVADWVPGISADGTTLMWASAEQRGGVGHHDLWMSTRGQPHPCDR